MLNSLTIQASSITRTFTRHPPPTSPTPSSHPPLHINFHTTRREHLRYLKSIGVVRPDTKLHKLPSPDAISHILSTVNFFKSKGFSDPDFPRLVSVCPELFSPNFHVSDTEPVFKFLSMDLGASPHQSCGLIANCPDILLTDVEYCLRPTLDYLRQIGVQNLNAPTILNANLLNIRIGKLQSKVMFLRSIGFSEEEARRCCARLPAIFKYSVENNMKRKYVYLVKEMGRSVEELKQFPQYFGFSLETRIHPRHLHLKAINVKVRLDRMLKCSDQNFYRFWDKPGLAKRKLTPSACNKPKLRSKPDVLRG
ncbi:Transcription termination factor MTEF1, chloroplastic [Linum grandiflorum]